MLFAIKLYPGEKSDQSVSPIMSSIQCEATHPQIQQSIFSQGFDPLLPHFSIHHFMNEEIGQREDPVTGFSIF